EGGPAGSYNAIRFTVGLPSTMAQNMEHYAAWGGPDTSPHYSAAWALAGNTPFRYYKQTTYGGGVRVPFIVSWPKRIKGSGELRPQFHNLCDIMPTVLEAAGIEPPSVVEGSRQRPLDGVSMLYSLGGADAPGRKHAQYFELYGNRAIWADGWKAIVDHYHQPWNMAQARPWSADRWELYHVAEDI